MMGDIQGTKKNLARLQAAKAARSQVGKQPVPEELTQTEAEAALHELLDRHQKWLMTQPAMLLLWPLDRATRRRVAELLAKELLTIPVREFNENTPPSRAMRRAIMVELRRKRWEEAGT